MLGRFPAGLAEGHVFRPVNRGDALQANAWAKRSSGRCSSRTRRPPACPASRPHDCRRTCAKLCRAAGGELEQIQLLWATRRSRRRSDTSAPSRIWSTRQTTRSS